MRVLLRSAVRRAFSIDPRAMRRGASILISDFFSLRAVRRVYYFTQKTAFDSAFK